MDKEVVLLSSEGLGTGSAELGQTLLGNFLRMLTLRENRPRYLILWNAAVKLAGAGSRLLEHLRRLEEQGVDILCCGTCVEYFGLADSLQVGEVSNMREIQELLLSKPALTL